MHSRSRYIWCVCKTSFCKSSHKKKQTEKLCLYISWDELLVCSTLPKWQRDKIPQQCFISSKLCPIELSIIFPKQGIFALADIYIHAKLFEIYKISVLFFCVGKCALLKNPKNGYFVSVKPRNYNYVKRLFIICDYGFIPHGQSFFDCENGKWSSSAPRCVP